MYQLTRLFLMVLLVTTIACGQTHNQSQNQEPGSETLADIDMPSQESILRMMGTEAQLSALDGNSKPLSVQVSSGDHIVVLDEVRKTQDGQEWIAVVVDRNDDSLSDTIYVQPQDLLSLPVAVMTIGNDEDWAFSEETTDTPDSIAVTIAGYEKIVPTVRAARMTYCYRYVKKYLLKIGLVKTYLPGASAYQAAAILPKYGFKKVSRKPNQAIVNDVCVYKGGPKGHGHIEIKTSKGWYYGYGYKAAPIKNRIFIGCFHK